MDRSLLLPGNSAGCRARGQVWKLRLVVKREGNPGRSSGPTSAMPTHSCPVRIALYISDGSLLGRLRMAMQYVHRDVRPEFPEGVGEGVAQDRVCIFLGDRATGPSLARIIR